MKVIPKEKGVYSFSRDHAPVERVRLGELIMLETEDAVGGQVRCEDTTLESIDWTRVNKATGPIYVEGVEKGDTLIVDILDIELAPQGVILVVPGAGALGDMEYKPRARIARIENGFVVFRDVKLPVRPVIGTIGVAPEEGSIPTAVPHRHGGNLDCIEVTRGARLYLPVYVDGALFAAGDLHAVQEDGELCVASIEVEGRILLRFGVVKGRRAQWPIVEGPNHFSILVSDEDLDKAVRIAAEEAVKAIMRARDWEFEDAYMLSSLCVKIAVNQVVDPKKGVRAIIPKTIVSLKDLLSSA